MISRKSPHADSADRPWLHGVPTILQQPVVVLDRDHRILAANQLFYHLIDIPRSAAVGRRLNEVTDRLLNATDLDNFLDSIEPAPLNPNTYRLEANRGAPGRRTFVLSALRIPDELSGGAAIVAIEETTPPSTIHQHTATAAAHMDGWEQALPLIAATSHDLRQPLQTLSLLQGVLAAKEKDPELRNLVERLEEAIEALTGMLNALLSANQLKAGLIMPAIATFPIGLVINRLRTEFAYHASAKGLKWRVVPSSVAVRTDPQLLGQVLRALLLKP